MCVRRVESMTHYRVILCLKMTPFTANSSKNIYPFTVLPFCQPLELRSKIFIMPFFTIITFDLQTLFCKETLKMEPFSRCRTVPCLSLKITPFLPWIHGRTQFQSCLELPPGYEQQHRISSTLYIKTLIEIMTDKIKVRRALCHVTCRTDIHIQLQMQKGF